MASRQQTLLFIIVVAVAFTLSTLTSLRFADIPVGPAELLLIGCLLVHLPMGNGVHGGNVPNRFVPVMVLLFFATLPGYFVTLLREGSVPWAMYNLIASAWVVVLFAYLHYGFDHTRNEVYWLVRLFLLFSTLYFGIVLILAAVSPVTVYTGENILDRLDTVATASDTNELSKDILRLQGFTTWPNQLALHALVCCFFAIALWKRNGTMLSLVCLGLALVAGLLTRSDAFLFSVVAILCLWIAAGIFRSGNVVLMLIVLVPCAVISLLLLKPVVNEIQEISQTGGQDETRFLLWEHGIDAGLERPLTGLGPGIWSGKDSAREYEEAHNSVIDYFSNAGVPGTLLMIIAIGVLLWRALLSSQPAMFAGAAGILLYAMFHNVLRQPIFWLSLYFIAQSVWPGMQSRMSDMRRSGSRRRRRVRSGSKGLPV